VNADCPREFEIVQAVLTGRLQGDDDMRAHTLTCDTCGDASVLATILRADRDTALGDVHLPAAGQVWWRAAIRARLEATTAAARPMTWAHGVAGACATGLTIGIIGLARPTLDRGWAWLGDHAGNLSPDAVAVAELVSAALQRTLPFGVAAACLLLAPVALYLALTAEERCD
jgi:hypothetical protein